jgi:ABC-type bacteriocin/lantibiotic exporter with double-glycine peptidase domain
MAVRKRHLVLEKTLASAAAIVSQWWRPSMATGPIPRTCGASISISLKGSTLAHLIQIGSQIKLASRPVKLELTDLDKLRLPAILHWDFNHFVVLTGGLEPLGRTRRWERAG